MNSKQRFLSACQNRPVDRPPVWIMRQAGRTLPEYRALREKHDFWETMTTPELAATVTLQPVKRFSMDAAVIFSDILTVPSAMGLEVAFSPKLAISPTIKTMADVTALKVTGAVESISYVGEAIKCVRQEMGDGRAILGFCGAPYTLASYMVEGGSSRSFHKIKALMHREPALYTKLLDAISEVAADLLELQVNAGVDAVQIFDSWAGELSPSDFRDFSLPYVKKLVERMNKTGTPVIYYINGVGNLLEAAKDSGAGVLGIDWRIELAEVRRRLGKDTVVQGNLDPATLFAPAEVVKRKTFEMLNQTQGLGHIANLGHGVLPDTPIEGIQAFIDAVSAWARQKTG